MSRIQERLQRILKLGSQLERQLNDGRALPVAEHELFQHRLESVTHLVPEELAQSIRELQKIFLQRQDARSLVALLAPLERLAQASIKDGDWLPVISNQDRPTTRHTGGALVFVLDNLRSAYNVGSIIRTADALGVQSVYCCGYTPNASHSLVQKAALGAQGSVQVLPHNEHQTLSVTEVMTQLHEAGYTLVAMETSPQARSLFQIQLPQKTALVFGNERFGLSPQTVAACHQLCEVPMQGVKNSLNVAVTAAVVGYEYLRQREI
jgi:23S rRNA (guanosine2251-2'-O)-methyltransferase